MTVLLVTVLPRLCTADTSPVSVNMLILMKRHRDARAMASASSPNQHMACIYRKYHAHTIMYSGIPHVDLHTRYWYKLCL